MDYICGSETYAAGGKMIRVHSYAYLVEEGGDVVEWLEPHFFNNGREEDAELALNCPDEVLTFEFGGPRSFCLDLDSIGGIIGKDWRE